MTHCVIVKASILYFLLSTHSTKGGDMELTWWGTAGFQVNTSGHLFLIDPYLSRNATARPKQALVPSAISRADQIFVSHGHFDHILDIPAIAAQTDCKVYCCPVAAKTLIQKGLKTDQIQEIMAGQYATGLRHDKPLRKELPAWNSS